MKIHMTFKHMDATESIKRHAEEHSEKISKFVGAETKFDWVFFVDAGEHVAELRVKGPHLDVFAQDKTGDLYRSIEGALLKVEKQLQKHKEITKDHLHRK